MPQVLEFALPDLGEGLTEAQIVTWLVEIGDTVAIDQPVVEVETAKAMVEVPCPHGGVVTARHGDEGQSLPVGAPLVSIAVEGEGGTGPGLAAGTGAGAASAGSASSAASSEAPDTAAADTASADDGGSGNVLVGYGTGTATAVRRRRVRTSATTAPTVRVREAEAPAPAAPEPAAAVPAVAVPADVAEGPVPVISPLVRKLARDNGIDLRALSGSGPEGLIVRADIERAVADSARTPASAEPVPDAAGERVPLRGMRGAAAEKLSRSRTEIPDATCWVDADATGLLAARAAMNAAGGEKISVLALFARITSAALARFPELNSRVDTVNQEIVRLKSVHLGFAAQTERGLVVPVLREVQGQNAEQLSAGLAALTRTARDGRLTPAQLTGGTFTLNNYGVFGVDGSTPIINHPEAAMLGIGRITPKPWVHEGELAVRQVVQLSLTFDHRVCDGGVAGGFLRYVADCVEHPALLLRTL
ncbi:dihydrolipoamide acetyltransferase family protein [Streptomyces sp. NPDC088923]|uniref:dihydrolipoamide acetyltransferase family protein n=1 Tax=Streptomyces sp. NPDC088923 TaxID=3365913 RepID=UPI003800507C